MGIKCMEWVGKGFATGKRKRNGEREKEEKQEGRETKGSIMLD